VHQKKEHRRIVRTAQRGRESGFPRPTPFFMAFLTIEHRAGTQGEAREAATAKAPQTEGIDPGRVAGRGRACPPWCCSYSASSHEWLVL
jgi:hypothetical protein